MDNAQYIVSLILWLSPTSFRLQTKRSRLNLVREQFSSYIFTVTTGCEILLLVYFAVCGLLIGGPVYRPTRSMDKHDDTKPFVGLNEVNPMVICSILLRWYFIVTYTVTLVASVVQHSMLVKHLARVFDHNDQPTTARVHHYSTGNLCFAI